VVVFGILVQVTFDADVISYEDILVIFMTTHDPTTLNKQGADRGTQYRSVIYYHDNLQKDIAEVVSKEVSSYYENPIVTEVSALDSFYEAEKEHQNYYKNNQTQGYCSFVITPKLTKLRKLHSDKLKN
jgi:peptide-methionine (S)-S-oxide reductase